MKKKSVRLVAASLIAAVSVLGLSQAPASATTAMHVKPAKLPGSGGWCC